LRASDVPDPTIFFQLEDLLTTYNLTLQQVECPINYAVGVQGRVREALRRNASLRRVESALRARGYRVEQRSLLPRAAERVGRMPTLLYRLLRRGNASALADQVARGRRPLPLQPPAPVAPEDGRDLEMTIRKAGN
jgi:hypothetical protein